MLTLLPCMAAMLRLIPLLAVARGILTTQKGSSDRDDPEAATTTAAPAASPQGSTDGYYTANVYSNRSEDTIHHTLIMARRGGALEAISVAVLTDRGNTGFQYHGDVLVNEGLHRCFKGGAFSIPGRQTGDEVGWETRIDLEIPVAAEGFKISRLSTSLQNYVPKKELKFDIGRLRELEERARRFLPDRARNWTDDHLLDICDKQLRSYLSYVQEKEGLPYPDPFVKGYAAMFTPLFMWLVGGEGGVRTPDRLPRYGKPRELRRTNWHVKWKLWYREWPVSPLPIMLTLLPCMAAMLRLIPLLVVAGGILTTQKGSSDRDDPEAATTAPPAASPRGPADGYYTANVYSNRSKDTIHHTLSFGPGEALEAVSVSVVSNRYVNFQYHADVLVNEEVRRRFKSEQKAFLMAKQKKGSQVASLKDHLLARLSDPKGPGWWFLGEKFAGKSVCRDFQSRTLELGFNRLGTTGWHIRIDMEMPVPAEGFKISRLSTTLFYYKPKEELKFDIGRLRELEERARRSLPDRARNWTDDHLLDICDKQLRSYLSYVQEKGGLPYPDPFVKGYAAMFAPLFMWLAWMSHSLS
ncbi:hypothetical protein FOZ62_009173 [Perkinsus olseni]|nr:hypothetical protein FOZ62_009173 [Perkinsus olseni]